VTLGPLSAFRRLGASRRFPEDAGEHRPDHARLLVDVASLPAATAPSPGTRELDAIIVPTARPWQLSLPSLHAAAELAAGCGAALVLLCSQDADVEHLPAELFGHDAAVVAVDVHDPCWTRLLPQLATNAHPLARQGAWDTPLKRNLGLLMASSQGWEWVLFLDDDVDIAAACGVGGPRLQPDSVMHALRWMRGDPSLRLVGWKVESFPDNSVICHVRRLVGQPQECFVGAGALLVRVDTDLPFFPAIYNEDWLFAYALLRRTDTTVRMGVAGVIPQRAYDPFDPTRARSEELGDLIAEGLFASLAAGSRGRRWTLHPAYWKAVQYDRLRMVRSLGVTITGVGRLRSMYAAELAPLYGPGLRAGVRLRMNALAALAAAARVLAGQDGAGRPDLPELAVDYLAAWRTDLRRWRRRLRRAGRLPVSALLHAGAASTANPAWRKAEMVGGPLVPPTDVVMSGGLFMTVAPLAPGPAHLDLSAQTPVTGPIPCSD
jgi:hypothetical protein